MEFSMSQKRVDMAERHILEEPRGWLEHELCHRLIMTGREDQLVGLILDFVEACTFQLTKRAVIYSIGSAA
jgi:hypothetical protein